jgi:hypothetical protein
LNCNDLRVHGPKKASINKKVPTRLMVQNLLASAIQLILKSGEGAFGTSLQHKPEIGQSLL